MPRKFDFISPGILLNEVDQSVLPAETQDEGPLIIGRSLVGPAMKPIRVRNLEDFYTIFGTPVTGAGNLSKKDIWRNGNLAAPTYAMFAAQAHLASNTTPITFMRLVGYEDPNATPDGKAGWKLTTNIEANGGDKNTNVTAYGLFVSDHAEATTATNEGSLCAVFYAKNSVIRLKGLNDDGAGTGGVAELIKIDSGANYKLTHIDAAGSTEYEFNFKQGDLKFIRNRFNTNPQKLEASTNFDGTNETLLLGESYELAENDISGAKLAVLVPLANSSNNWANKEYEAQKGETGWFINRNLDGKQEELFKLIAHSDGEQASANYWIQISDLKLGSTVNPNSSFTLRIMNNGSEIEKFTGCTLNPSSDGYIAKKIGDQYQVWDSAERKFNTKGLYRNRSDYFYVVVSDAVKNQTISDSLALPVGFQGPPVHPDVYIKEGEAAASETENFGAASPGTKAKLELEIDPGNASATDRFKLLIDGIEYIFYFNDGNGSSTQFDNSNIAELDIQNANSSLGADLETILSSEAAINDNYTFVNSVDSITIEAKVASTSFTIGVSDNSDNALSTETATAAVDPTSGGFDAAYFTGGLLLENQNSDASNLIGGMKSGRVIKFSFPAPKLTVENSKSSGNYEPSDVFGLRHIPDDGTQWDASYADVVRSTPGGPKNTLFKSAYTFTLEDMQVDNLGLYYFEAGSEKWKDDVSNMLNAGIRQFAAPVVGGFEGVDIFKTDPFSPYLVGNSNQSSYERYSLNLALDIASDTETVEYDTLCIPGQTNSAITNKIISICETRGDALAIIDTKEIYKHTWETGAKEYEPKVKDVVKEVQNRTFNTSFAATYYPSVILQDTANGSDDVVICPPSVAAIGAIAKSQAISDPWFAPAGFNRGGINELGGSNGPRITGTKEHLTKANRDSLYEENINPIAKFPASGDIVIFGQKTLQQTPSALDRINVRRLLLYIKRRIGKISETILFDNNVNATWNRFKGQADAVLRDVQARLGIVEYRLVLDETTTTADLVDRNILYAKVLIKPARAIEFIVVDFVVTRSGIEL